MDGTLQNLQSQCKTQAAEIVELQRKLASTQKELECLKQKFAEKVTQHFQQLDNLRKQINVQNRPQQEDETVPKRPRLTEEASVLPSQSSASEDGGNSKHQNTVHVQHADQVVLGDIHYPQASAPDHKEAADGGAWQKHLSRLVKEIAGQIDVPVELQQAIQAVTLQLSKEVKKSPTIIEEGGHYTRRDDLKQMYSAPKGNIRVESMFDLASRNADQDASKYCGNEEAKVKYLYQHGNNVLVIGQAGIGKTTLTKIVAQLALDKKILPQTEFIMYVRLRDVDFDQETDLIHFIATKGAFDEANLTVEQMLSLLKDNPNVLLIFDGVDEVRLQNLGDPAHKCSHDEFVKPAVILGNLMSGVLLPHAKKVWTCRSRQAYELHESHRPRTILQILGLDRAAQEDLGEQICQANWPRVKSHLLDHPDILAACYVPAICIITMASISLSLDDNLSDVPTLKTITQVLSFAVACYCRSDHIRAKATDLHFLAQLAWNGFSQGKVVFMENDYQDANISRDTFEAFLVTYVDKTASLKFKLLDGDKTSSFSHLIWQELFSAMHLMFFMSLEEFQSVVQSLLSSRWEVVTKFLFGLCNTSIKQKLQRLFSGSHPAFSLWQSKKQVLKEFAMQATDDLRAEEAQDQTTKLLLLSSWIREVDDLNFTSDVILRLPSNLNLSGTFFPTDAASVAYLIDSGLREWTVNVNNIQFVGDSAKTLFSAIARRNCKTPMLYLGFNELDDDDVRSIARCLNGTEKLWMVNCGLTETAIPALATGIAALQDQLQFLYLNNNPIGDGGVSALCECLHKLVVLNLNNCGITSGGVGEIATAVQKLTKPMHILCLRNNNVGDSGATCLSTCLNKLDVLDINNSKVTGTGAVELKEAISQLPTPMELINLGNNAIGDQGAFAFSKCLDKITELWLKDCGVTEVGVKQMTKMHSQMETKKPRVYLGQIPGMGVNYVDLM